MKALKNASVALVSIIIALIIYAMICKYAGISDTGKLNPPIMERVSGSDSGYDMAYYRDTLTGVIYIKGSQCLAVALNPDGTPMTYEQLEAYQGR